MKNSNTVGEIGRYSDIVIIRYIEGGGGEQASINIYKKSWGLAGSNIRYKYKYRSFYWAYILEHVGLEQSVM